MNVTIPKTLQKQVQKRAKKSGLSEAEYVRRALKETIAAEDDLAEEMELWELSSLQDFNRFA
jgi:metal-responsive CopG/Arc/MetJ family transcriptional regulator